MNICDIQNGKIVADYHIHFGQFYDVYYQPAYVIGALAANGIKRVWGSSTTACLRWNTAGEKDYILKHITDEIKEATFVAEKCGLEFVPLYRVIPKLHREGVGVADYMDGESYYKGFKIHTLDDGYEDEDYVNILMEEVCEYAARHNLPILIHTGEDDCVAPERFERFFGVYGGVKFVLAHCKEAERVIALFKKYDNVFGDTAFCPYISLSEIYKRGYADRMQIGTDFPVTHYWCSYDKCGRVSKKVLTTDYKRVAALLQKEAGNMAHLIK